MPVPTPLPEPEWPARFAMLKRKLVPPENEAQVIQAWNEIIEELDRRRKEIVERGSDIIPQVEFESLSSLSNEEIANIRKTGSVIIRNVVDDTEAVEWKETLEKYIEANPSIEGFPEDSKQFFMIYWSESQLKARSHPNVLAATVWLNSLYHTGADADGKSEVSLTTPLTYADRFRIRKPDGNLWNRHPPHIDGGSIERWEDKNMSLCYMDVLNGNWKQHDPYDITHRLDAHTNIYGRSNQCRVFRSWQGWLAMANIAPGNGTIRFFPDVMLSNSYIQLRPFFTPLGDPSDLSPSNWKLDLSSENRSFPGIQPFDKPSEQYGGIRPSDSTHPHLVLEETMTSVPKVKPGDMVFWHADVIHSVEAIHNGTEDSAVLYVPAVPLTPQNASYVAKQREAFLVGKPPQDFPQGVGEGAFDRKGLVEHIISKEGRKAMGLEEYDVTPQDKGVEGAEKAIQKANQYLGLKA